MSNTAFSHITGLDGEVPVYSPNSRFQIWSLAEIYTGSVGANRYVPNVNDRVIDLSTNEWYSVTAINPVTFVPTLEIIKVIPEDNFSSVDKLLGVGPGTQSDTYRCYINKSVLPHTLCVDARLRVFGSNANSAIIYKGSHLDGSAVAISAIYDQSGNMLGQNIPLELVGVNNGLNLAIKTVPVCHTVSDLLDGEVVTVVFYSANGIVVSKRQLLIENTAFIRNTDDSIKYIIDIRLESPFLSQNDNKLIQYPLNVPINGLMLIGVVTYSDGSQLRMPVDGGKFSIFGFAGYIATIVGQKFNLVLKYTLSSDEVVYGAQSIGNQLGGNFITSNYRAITLKANGAFSIKLYPYPVWVNELVGYQIRWYMYTLDRSNVYDVTPYVSFNSNSIPFNPVGYGIKQTLGVSVNLQNVNAIFSDYKHVQSVDITLVAPGTARTTNWTIGFAPNQTPPFGNDNFAISTMVQQPLGSVPSAIWSINLTSAASSLADWLDRLYYKTLPLTDLASELVPPVPNMFALVVDGVDVEFPITAWNTTLTLPGAVPNNSTIFIKFIMRMPDNDLQLGISAMPVYQI